MTVACICPHWVVGLVVPFIVGGLVGLLIPVVVPYGGLILMHPESPIRAKLTGQPSPYKGTICAFWQGLFCPEMDCGGWSANDGNNGDQGDVEAGTRDVGLFGVAIFSNDFSVAR